MGLDNIVSYFIKDDIYKARKVFFLGYPSIIFNGSYPNEINLDFVDWVSCDLSKSHQKNFNINFLELDIDKKFDLIIDHGCLQHIYNPIKALEQIFNISNTGTIVHHNLPYNNFPGFGYYQFSPEIFVELEKLSLIDNLELYLTDEQNKKYYFEIKKNIVSFRFNFGKLMRIHVKYKITHNSKKDIISEILNSDNYQKELFKNEMDDFIFKKSGIFYLIRHSDLAIFLIGLLTDFYYFFFKIPPKWKKNTNFLKPKKYI